MAHIEINDAIHRTIILSQKEERVVDHPYVQRLRYVRQLGFVPYVYPSATHDRFSHSLGTMHIAGLLAHQMLNNEGVSAIARILSPEQKEFLTRIVRLAGLLHDVGHAPFSHPAETAMPDVSSLALSRQWLIYPDERRRATHEDYSVLLIAGMTEGKDAVLTAEEAEIISSLVHHKKIKIPSSWKDHFSEDLHPESLHCFVRLLVSSNLDADRMDYLLRDSHFTGVTYGHYDIPWLISNLGALERDGDYVMSIADSGVGAFEHYIFARYHMYIQVYMHKTVKCFEYYFQKALAEGETRYKIPASREEYTAMRDSTLLEQLFTAALRNPRSWSGRLIRREPSKRIARIWGNRQEVEKVFRNVEQELKPLGVTPFMHFSRSEFLELSEAKERAERGKQGMFLLRLASMPAVVIRKQFGVVSAASLADHSFILQRYHQDISYGDIYILPEEFSANETAIQQAIKKFRELAPSEITLDQDAG